MNNIQNNRRNFLKLTGTGMMASLLPSSLLHAYTGGKNGKKLILLSLSGGCDTANIFVPYNESNYYALRPTIAVAKKDVLVLNDTLGLNPKFTNLKKIWDNNHLALFPATHSGLHSNTSHFYQYDFFDSGSYVKNGENDMSTGWLARYFNAKYGTTKNLYAYNFVPKRKMFQHANTPAFEYSAPYNISLVAAQTKSHLQEMMEKKNRKGEALKIENAQKSVFSLVNRLSGLGMEYAKTNTKLYNNFSNSIKILNGISELEVIQLEHSGYDTHHDEAKRLEGVKGNDKKKGLFAELDEAIGHLYTTLEENGELDNTLLVVHTEFGRTADENGSGGTDHGQASAWFVIGGSVKGGQRGIWPGFAKNQLIQNAKTKRYYLKQETDYRDILSQALDWLGGDAQKAFPGYVQNLKANEIYL
ncbi:MAG: hypothetical protein DSZ12_05095 [Sulfurovum sp.]|nr:MAG: hypothetical protein DSZ12_05095 [Sulfurovum sp.]